MYSLFILTKSVLKYPSFYEIQLLFSAQALVIWTIIVIPIYATPELLVESEIIFIEHVSTIIGSFGVLFFIFSIINTFTYKLVIFPRITIIGFAMIIGSKIIQLTLSPSETIYGFQLGTNNELIRVSPIFFSLIIGLSYLFLYLSLIFFLQNQNKLPSYIVGEKIKNYSMYAFFILTGGIIFQSIGTLFVMDAFLSEWVLLLARFLITTGFIFIVFQFTKNPVLSFSEKGNPAQFIANGTINWLLIGNRDFGPESLKSSSNLKTYFNQEELQLFAVKLITSISLGSGNYNEEICIIPHSNLEKKFNLVAIGFSFLHKDIKVKDIRRKGMCELLFAIVVPSILLSYLHNLTIDAMREPLMVNLKNTENIDEFLQLNLFDFLTAKMLRNLSEKKVF